MGKPVKLLFFFQRSSVTLDPCSLLEKILLPHISYIFVKLGDYQTDLILLRRSIFSFLYSYILCNRREKTRILCSVKFTGIICKIISVAQIPFYCNGVILTASDVTRSKLLTKEVTCSISGFSLSSLAFCTLTLKRFLRTRDMCSLRNSIKRSSCSNPCKQIKVLESMNEKRESDFHVQANCECRFVR